LISSDFFCIFSFMCIWVNWQHRERSRSNSNLSITVTM
jgi:uncharacterized membrane protein